MIIYGDMIGVFPVSWHFNVAEYIVFISKTCLPDCFLNTIPGQIRAGFPGFNHIPSFVIIIPGYISFVPGCHLRSPLDELAVSLTINPVQSPAPLSWDLIHTIIRCKLGFRID